MTPSDEYRRHLCGVIHNANELLRPDGHSEKMFRRLEECLFRSLVDLTKLATEREQELLRQLDLAASQLGTVDPKVLEQEH